jgi:crotonobetainyl-CoA:carnitine CoA-transferase CaiB-like acyl-CoA transferase
VLVAAADPAFAKNSERVRQRERVMSAMRVALAARGRTEVADALRAHGVPAGEVNSVAQALADPHVVARGMVEHFEHPRAGSFPALRNPLRFTGYDNPYVGVPPLLGADTEAIENELGAKAQTR